MAKLDADAIREALRGLQGWTLGEDAIRKEFSFRGFRAAIAFIDRLAEKAQAARHHPDLENHYNVVVVSLTTHDEGGVTEADLQLARDIESVVEAPEG